jgi:hypothetical protein
LAESAAKGSSSELAKARVKIAAGSNQSEWTHTGPPHTILTNSVTALRYLRIITPKRKNR